MICSSYNSLNRNCSYCTTTLKSRLMLCALRESLRQASSLCSTSELISYQHHHQHHHQHSNRHRCDRLTHSDLLYAQLLHFVTKMKSVLGIFTSKYITARTNDKKSATQISISHARINTPSPIAHISRADNQPPNHTTTPPNEKGKFIDTFRRRRRRRRRIPNIQLLIDTIT